MRMINYDADQNDALKCLSFEPFVLDVIRNLEVQSLDPTSMADTIQEMFNAPIRFFICPKYENVAKLIHTIPIYLCKSKELEEKVEVEGRDVLGSYCYWNIPYQSLSLSPFIVLYPSEIFRSSGEYEKQYGSRADKWLFTQVLLHELGHAVMDLRNYLYFHDLPDDLAGWKTRRVIEESMANAISLRIINSYEECKDCDEFHSFVSDFCQNKQAPEYALGVDLEKSIDFNNDIINEYCDAKRLGLDDVDKEKWNSFLLDITESRQRDAIARLLK